MAVLKAFLQPICLLKITVSKQIDVTNPLNTAIAITKSTGQLISINWKKAIVPKSPIAQPNRHHDVFFDADIQVVLHVQLVFFIAFVKTIKSSIVLILMASQNKPIVFYYKIHLCFNNSR